MTPHVPVEDPSDRGSLADRTVAYVRGHPLLRLLLIATILSHLGAILCVVLGRLSGQTAGIMALLSVLSWFFAVCLPVMNREVRASLGGAEVTYWSQVAEMFFRVLLCVVTGLYAAAVVYAFA